MGKVGQKLDENKELSARMMAVQAYYQTSQNAKPVKTVIQEYLDRGLHLDLDGEDVIVKPHGGLFKRILLTLEEHLTDAHEIMVSHISKVSQKTDVTDDTDVIDEDEADDMKEPIVEKDLEPLLKSIILCGICEILVHQDIDAPLIIDDYLNVTHAFYEKPQVSFVNGVLDNVCSAVRN